MSFSNNTGAAFNGAVANSRSRNVINRILSNEWTLSDLSKFDNYEYIKFSRILGGSISLFHRYEHAKWLFFRRPLVGRKSFC